MKRRRLVLTWQDRLGEMYGLVQERGSYVVYKGAPHFQDRLSSLGSSRNLGRFLDNLEARGNLLIRIDRRVVRE